MRIARLSLMLLSTAVLACVTAHAGPLLVLFPPGSAVSGGDISGAPGDITGWGFTFIEPDSVFDVVTGSAFCLGSSDGVTDSCIPPVLGAYTDFIGPQFIVVGPDPESSSLHQDFDPIAALGVGSFTLDPGAAPGAIDSGQVVVTYDVYAQDPNLVFSDPIATGQFVTALASVTVEESSPVPEPGTAALVAAFLIVLAFRHGHWGDSAAVHSGCFPWRSWRIATGAESAPSPSTSARRDRER